LWDPERCRLCKSEGFVVWHRLFPAPESFLACISCHDLLSHGAEACRTGPADPLDLLVTARSFGGELWKADGIEYWLRKPATLPPTRPTRWPSGPHR